MRKVVRSVVKTVCIAGCLMLFLSGSSFAKEEKSPEVLYQKGLYLETAKAVCCSICCWLSPPPQPLALAGGYL